jgi:hypothetical protein
MLAKTTSNFYHKFIKIFIWYANDRYAHIIKTSWLDYAFVFKLTFQSLQEFKQFCHTQSIINLQIFELH